MLILQAVGGINFLWCGTKWRCWVGNEQDYVLMGRVLSV